MHRLPVLLCNYECSTFLNLNYFVLCTSTWHEAHKCMLHPLHPYMVSCRFCLSSLCMRHVLGRLVPMWTWACSNCGSAGGSLGLSLVKSMWLVNSSITFSRKSNCLKLLFFPFVDDSLYKINPFTMQEFIKNQHRYFHIFFEGRPTVYIERFWSNLSVPAEM